MNKEKQEIKAIINEIDKIMFGRNYKMNFEEATTEVVPAAITGAIFGLVANIGFDSPSNMLVYTSVGALVGGTLGCIGIKDSKSNIYQDYEYAYLHLLREEQIEVLKLSKRLFELYKQETTKEQNKKIINKYLQINQENTMFDAFEFNHPQLKLLTEEEIEKIHKKGKLTSTEKFHEWKRLNYCPGSINSDFRCVYYDTCRDCTVAWANEKEEWDEMKNIPVGFVKPNNERYRQISDKYNKDVVKRKTKKA